jgi:ubiquinone/menaquinone biosynthesis C-methylase UbiE
MEAIVVCPNCKNNINKLDHSYFCNKCNKYYNINDGYIDFIPDVTFYAGEVPQVNMNELIADIDLIGFDEALKKFFTKFPFLHSYILDKRRADWIYHGLGKNTKRCLDIGSGLGNISERLSYLYDEVYSVEAVKERVEFQKRRYNNSNRSNIFISRSNVLQLPFKDNFFDLVVCNGVLEWIGMMNKNHVPRKAQLLFLMELKRVLKDNGCLYIGIENRIGLPFILGAKDHSGIHYTSILPRQLANLVVKKFGNSGGIYGDGSIKKKEERGYFTYTYTIFGYRSLLKEAGLNIKSYWVFPSYNEPYYKGKLDDNEALKGFLHFIKNVYTGLNSKNIRIQIALSLTSKMHKSIIGLVVNLLSPSFLFYCYKNELEMSLDDFIVNKTSLKNFTTISEGSDIKYLLYNDKETPTKILHLKRDLKHIPQEILFHNKTNPNDLPSPSEKIWIADWVDGKNIDPFNLREIKMAIEWLINFQNQSIESKMNKEFIINNVSEMSANIKSIVELDITRLQKFIDAYKSYLLGHHLNISPEHGDFWHGNILIDNKDVKNRVSIIDWEYYKYQGDPLFDFVFFIINTILLPRISLDLIIRNKFDIDILKEIKPMIARHFGFELDLAILIPFTLLRYIIRRRLEKGIYDEDWIKYSKILTNI